jgi:hypothetical protein
VLQRVQWRSLRLVIGSLLLLIAVGTDATILSCGPGDATWPATGTARSVLETTLSPENGPTSGTPLAAHSATAAPSSQPEQPRPVVTAQGEPLPQVPAGSKYGIQLLLDDGRSHWSEQVWPQHLQAARQIVGERGYVLQLIRLDDLDVQRWQFFLDLCAQQSLTPILRLAPTYDFEHHWWMAPPTDAMGQSYVEVAQRTYDFFAQLRWPGPVHYVIVGNEPNRGDEWGNRPDPAAYARFLRDVSDALHRLGITILGPALDMYAPNSNSQLIGAYRYMDAESFLDGMLAADPQIVDAIDVWASHAYPLDPFRLDPSRQVFQIDYANGATNPRHVQPPDGIWNRGINSYRWEIWKLEQVLGPQAASLPVMITETGWRHAPTQDPKAADEVHADVSFETQSAYLDLAFHGNHGRYPNLPETGWTPWDDDPQVLAAVVFALGGLPAEWGHTNWVVLDGQGQITDLYPITLGR